MPTLICMYGLPRSGKSTISRELSRMLSAPIVNQDNIRLALHGQAYAKEAEPMVRAIAKVMVDSLFRSSHEYVIADETHYSRAKRDFMKDGPWQTFFYEVNTPPEVCLARAAATNQPWLLSVIPEMEARKELLGDDELRWDELAILA